MTRIHRKRLAWVAAVVATATLLVVWLTRTSPERVEGTLARSPGVGVRATPEASGGPAHHDAPPVEGQPRGEPASALPGPNGALQVVVTAGGRPVPGAEVHVYHRAVRHGGADGWSPVASANASGDGILLVPAAPGAYLVTATAGGLARGYAETVRPTGEALTKVELRLQPGGVVSGRTVERGTRRDVPLVALSFAPARVTRRGLPHLPPEEVVAVVSDRRGLFRVAGLATGRWHVEARVDGHAPAVAELQVPRSEELVVELSAAAMIEGLVTRDGGPVPHAVVTITGSREPVVLESGPGGAFAAEVEPGIHRVLARLAEETGATDRPITVSAGVTVRGVEVRLGASARVTGSVRTRMGPVTGALVVASEERESGSAAQGRSAPDGTYELHPLAPGIFTVTATANHAAVSVTGITLRAGERFPLNLVLGDPTMVEGVVTDSSGTPVSGALVTVAGGWFRGGNAGAQAAARTDASGRYQLEGLAGGPIRVSARRDESSPASTRTLMLEEGTTAQLDLVLADGGVVAGTVLDARGNPVPGVTVATIDGGARPWTGGGRQVTTDDAGGYLLALPPGAYGLTAWRPDRALRFGVRPTTLATVNVTVGTRSQVDLVLPDEPITLAGRVLEPGGAPSGQAVVRVVTAAAGTLLVGADANGEFTASAAPGGEAVVSARNGGRAGTVTVTPPVSDLVVQLQPAASLQGRLVGDPAPETFSLTTTTSGAMRLGGGPSQLQFVGATFAVNDVAPGQLALHVKTDDGRLGDGQATVAAGEARSIDIVLSPAAVITGRLVDATTGQPVARGRIIVDGQVRRGGVAADGRFTRTVTAGAHQLTLVALGYAVLERSVTARPDAPNELGDLPLTPRPPPPTRPAP